MQPSPSIVRILYNAQSELIKLAIIISSPVCIYTKTQFVCASGKEWCMQMCMSVIISRVFRICCVFRCICRHTRYTAFKQWTLCCYVIGVHININCAVIQTAWSPVYMQCAEEKEKRKHKEWRGKAWNRRQNCNGCRVSNFLGLPFFCFFLLSHCIVYLSFKYIGCFLMIAEAWAPCVKLQVVATH